MRSKENIEKDIRETKVLIRKTSDKETKEALRRELTELNAEFAKVVQNTES